MYSLPAIEKHVPFVPGNRTGFDKGISAFLDALQVGDSFVVGGELVQSYRTLARRVGKIAGKRFVSRSEGRGLFRMWRIE